MARQCLSRRARRRVGASNFREKVRRSGGYRSPDAHATCRESWSADVTPSLQPRTHPAVSAKSPTEASMSASVVLSMVARGGKAARSRVTVARNPSPDRRLFRARRVFRLDAVATRSPRFSDIHATWHDRSHDKGARASARLIGAAVLLLTASRRRRCRCRARPRARRPPRAA